MYEAQSVPLCKLINYFNSKFYYFIKQNFYHVEVHLKTALCAIYMFAYFIFKLSVDYYILK